MSSRNAKVSRKEMTWLMPIKLTAECIGDKLLCGPWPFWLLPHLLQSHSLDISRQCSIVTHVIHSSMGSYCRIAFSTSFQVAGTKSFCHILCGSSTIDRASCQRCRWLGVLMVHRCQNTNITNTPWLLPSLTQVLHSPWSEEFRRSRLYMSLPCFHSQW